MSAISTPLPALRALVLGYGNPLRGDDALGSRVAGALAASPGMEHNALIAIETVHQLTPELAEAIARAAIVIFVDAAAPSPDRSPGSVRYGRVEPESLAPAVLGHHLTPAQALGYARNLYGANPEGYFASVTAESFNFGAPLSPAVQAAVPSLVTWVLARIESGGGPA